MAGLNDPPLAKVVKERFCSIFTDWTGGGGGVEEVLVNCTHVVRARIVNVPCQETAKQAVFFFLIVIIVLERSWRHSYSSSVTPHPSYEMSWGAGGPEESEVSHLSPLFFDVSWPLFGYYVANSRDRLNGCVFWYCFSLLCHMYCLM